MLSSIRMKVAALGLLLSGVAVGVAGAQIVANFQRVGSTSTGLFTISNGEAVNFHVALDDDSSGPVGQVRMRLYDHTGIVRKEKLVSLAPGQSSTLPWDVPGKYRAQYDVLESTTSLSARREVAATVEVRDLDEANPRRFVCNIPPPRW